jgi:uncharacterized protein (TIGR00290 family)
MSAASAWVSWSTGKDSAYALHVARRSLALDVSAVVCTMNASSDRVSMHAVRRALLEMQAQRLDLRLHTVELPAHSSFEQYDSEFRRAASVAEAAGVGAMVFGDLFLDDVRAYRFHALAHTQITPIVPLWNIPTDRLAIEIVEAGVCAIVTCVDLQCLPADFVGRPFDETFLQDLPRDVDPCGERGEFHTFVWDSPDFSAPIAVQIGERVTRDGFAFCDLTPKAEQST